ncbi:MAG: porphobilinogen synthase [Methanobacteriaceae archaeon]|nr:porphobilinogen synthase [Methanobacteriaceae archaeon]
MDFPTTRMRRLRKNEAIRDIVRETKLLKEDLIYPIFVKDGLEDGNKEPIITMPDEYRYSVNDAVKYAKSLENKGLKSIIVFGIPIEEEKDEIGTPAFKSTGIVQRTIRQLKAETNLVVMGDVCLCQYTSHGHCGLISEDENSDNNLKILNDESLKYLCKVAVSQAEAGADVIAPSDMMDGRVGAIREALDDAGYEDVIIMAYSAKFASTFYAPFRDAACSAPGEGNRKSYQMDPANSKEALREVELDIIEGADIVMVKPAFPCLDIIHEVSENFNMPLATYSVSGEYSMLKTAVSENILPEESIMETMIAIKRAGAELIITNFAPYLLDKL